MTNRPPVWQDAPDERVSQALRDARGVPLSRHEPGAQAGPNLALLGPMSKQQLSLPDPNKSRRALALANFRYPQTKHVRSANTPPSSCRYPRCALQLGATRQVHSPNQKEVS